MTLRRVVAVCAVAALGFLAVAYAFRQPLARRALEVVAGTATGYDVRIAGAQLGATHAVLDGLEVRANDGTPVATVRRAEVTYSLRDAFGSSHPLGVSRLALDAPRISLVHYANGSWNVHLPSSSGGPSGGIPAVWVRIRDGALSLLDETRIYEHSRRLALEAIQLEANLDPVKRSGYQAGLVVVEPGGRFPLAGRATFDPARGYAMQRWHATRFALGPLVDYALNSPALHVADGELVGLDATLYGLGSRGATPPSHLTATTELHGMRLYLNGLAAPLRDGAGPLRAYDDGLAIPRVTGTVAGVPVDISGAIYDFADPALRLGITGNGALKRLAGLAANAGKVAIDGALGFRLLVEGPATQPMTLATLDAPHVGLNGYALDAVRAQVALAGNDLDVLRSRLRYGAIGVAAQGHVGLQRSRETRLVASVDAPANRLPLLAYAVPGMRLAGLAVLSGSGTSLAASGLLDGTGPDERLAGNFSIAGDGVGTVGPLELAGPGRQRLFLRAALDGQRGTAAWIDARAVRLGTRPLPALPGVRIPALPDARGDLDADLAGIVERKRYALAGNAALGGAQLRGVPVGQLAGRGFLRDGERGAFAGRYQGSLAPLGRLAGGKIALAGGADIPLALLADGPSHVVAQVDGARFHDARIAGVNLEGLSLTAGLAGSSAQVYAARVRLQGHEILAQGRLGDGGTLDVSTSGLDLAALRGFGVPLEQGELSAVAEVGGTAGAPTLHGGFVAAGYAQGLPVSASSELAFAGDRLSLRAGLLQAGDAVGTVEGDVDGLRSHPARADYALRAQVREADIASLAAAFNAPLRYPAGTLNASLEVHGSGTAPRVSGNASVPEGSLNGLEFKDASLDLRGTPTALALQGGQVTVGTSMLAFDGSLSRGSQSLSLHAPRLDLADFNDYFDRGDTLGGRGSLELTARNSPDSVGVWARAKIASAQFRRLNLGTTQADVTTRGRTMTLAGSIGGSTGEFSVNGTVQLPGAAPLNDTLRRSALALTTRAEHVDLGTWLPALGLRQPIAGSLNGEATLHGHYPALAFGLQGSVAGGRFGRVPIERLSLQTTAQNDRVTVGSASLALAGLDVEGSGTFGLRPTDAVALDLQADVPDVAGLYKTLTGKPAPDGIRGSAHTKAQLSGTPRQPRVHDDLTLDALSYRGYTLPHAHAALDATPALVTLETAEFDLTKGQIRADGRAPLELAPVPGVGPPTAPVNLELNAAAVDLAQFAPLLPKGTDLGGLLSGRIGLLGTLAQPALNGTLALVDLSFSSPQETAKLTSGTAQLTFQGTSASLHDAHVDVGGGTIALHASAFVPSLRAPGRDLTFSLVATATRAGLDLPAYFKGAVDGQLTLSKSPASEANLVGNLTFNDTRIPLSAVLGASGPSPAATPNLPDVALKLQVSAQRDVRIQSGQVDIGAQGAVRVGGTLDDPSLSGRFLATDGTLDFYRTFILGPDSTVAFTAALGLVPRVNAYATTSIPDPPTQVDLHVTGPATQMNVALQSDPPYTREQIVGLLAGLQNLGAVQGVAMTQSQQNNGNVIGNIAAGQLSGMFTRNILEPLGAHVGSAIGLSSLSLGYDPSAGIGLGARKALMKNVDVIYSETFNYPQRTTIGLRASPNPATAVLLTFFNQPNAQQFVNAPTNLVAGDPAVNASQPISGSNGFSFSLQRKFR
ncbi:MAG: translocation/assembly module TamB domain-containing protein [Vulcanimicrobiaceae bacterium]